MNLSAQIMLGVASGVLTSALLYICVRIFRDLALPEIRELLYRGVDISGPWHWKNAHGDSAKIELTQKADVLTGVYSYVNSSHQGDIKIFQVKGNVRDRFVQMTMQSADPKRLGALSYLLEVTGDGNLLKGCCSFYSSGGEGIVSQDESFFRTTEGATASIGDATPATHVKDSAARTSPPTSTPHKI
jgi:hypothetical protein